MSDNNEKKWTKTEDSLNVPISYSANQGLVEVDKSIKGNIENEQKKSKILSFKWIINNLTIILLLPSFIGTTWQIIELANINLAYIRFFSVTQVPADGAIFLLPTTIAFILFLLLKRIITSNFKVSIEDYNKLPFDKKLEVHKLELKSKRYIYQPLSYSIIILAFLVLNWHMLLPSEPIKFIFLMFFSFFAGGIVFADALIRLYKRNNIDSDINSVNTYEKIFKALLDNHKKIVTSIPIIFISLVLLIVHIANYFSENYIVPNDMYNIQKIEPRLINDFETKSYKLLYMNDKYIFIRICTKQTCSENLNNKIVIYPTQEIFFN